MGFPQARHLFGPFAKLYQLEFFVFQQERAMREMRGERGNAPPLQPPPAPPASMGLERPGRSQPVSDFN